MFMRHQRADGRIPGSIAVIDGKVVPQFNKFQGFCFPEPALDLYYLGGKDAEYLARLAKTLEAFDAYLWRVRDSDGDGCLETWCTNQRRCRGTGPVGRQGQSRAGQDGELPVGRCPRRDV